MSTGIRVFRPQAYGLLAAILLSSGCAQGLKSGEIAPDFVLTSIDGKRVRLADYAGDVVLLSFWAVGCPPCREEAAHLKTLHHRFGPRGLHIMAVNAWDEPKSMVESFARKQRLPYEILLNGADVHTGPYKGRGVPSAYLIDRGGVIRYVSHGWSEQVGRDLTMHIQRLLERG